MKIRTLVSMTVVMTLLLSMTGCVAVSGRDSGTDLMAGVQTESPPPEPLEPTVAFLDSVGDFSWNLFRNIVEEEGNILISPASVYLVLGMALNGADGPTRDAMVQTLSVGDLSDSSVNRSCRDWMSQLADTSKDTDLLIGNSIWFNDDFKADPDFLKVNANDYGADLRQIDFGDVAATDAVNNWVDQATDGKIKSILDKTSDDDAMYLLNAVYFKSEWQAKFSSSLTHRGDFNLVDGTVSANYMNRDIETDYISNDGSKGVLLPFSDPRFAFFAVLPGEGIGIREAVGNMDQAALATLLDSSYKTKLDLHLPRFELESNIDLIPVLTDLGMGDAFFGSADFSLMHVDRLKGLSITGCAQKTYFRIDEDGGEAAAVSGMTMAATTSMEEIPKKLVFDRPFLYGIVDTESGMPLFLGIMDNPD